MSTTEPTPPAPEADDLRWEVIASRPDYSMRGPQGRFASLEAAEEFAERLRGDGYRDVQIEPIHRDDPS